MASNRRQRSLKKNTGLTIPAPTPEEVARQKMIEATAQKVKAAADHILTRQGVRDLNTAFPVTKRLPGPIGVNIGISKSRYEIKEQKS
jgi:hypothetical protein